VGDQSRRESLIESALNVLVGYVVAVGSQMFIFPLFGIEMTVGKSLGIAWCFTMVSLARHYCIRRFFNGRLWREPNEM